MTKEIYNIFEVQDYKGGELCPSLNMSREMVVNYFMCNIDFEFEEPTERYPEDTDEEYEAFVKEEFISQYNDIIDELKYGGEYAGSTGFCGKIYKVENNILTEVHWGEFINEGIEKEYQSYLKNKNK